jgi:hypothetical protein
MRTLSNEPTAADSRLVRPLYVSRLTRLMLNEVLNSVSVTIVALMMVGDVVRNSNIRDLTQYSKNSPGSSGTSAPTKPVELKYYQTIVLIGIPAENTGQFFNSLRFHRLRVSALSESDAQSAAEDQFFTDLDLKDDEVIINWYSFEEFGNGGNQAGVRRDGPGEAAGDSQARRP